MISSLSNDFDFDADDFFKSHSHHVEFDPPIMEIVVSLVVVLGLAILLALCCKCCCSNKYKGRVLQPPPSSGSVPHPPAPGIYPQQQYNTITIPTAVVPGHVNVSYPTNAAPYPTASPYPSAAPYPGAAPYPSGAPYPGAAPYPGGAPYPAVAPYPVSSGPSMPQAQPSAPHEHAFFGVPPPGWHPQALPPSYDQAVSLDDTKHTTAYNPYAPH